MRKLTIHPHLRSTTYVLSNKLTDLLTIPIPNTRKFANKMRLT